MNHDGILKPMRCIPFSIALKYFINLHNGHFYSQYSVYTISILSSISAAVTSLLIMSAFRGNQDRAQMSSEI